MKEENNEIVSAAETISVDYEEILQRAVAVLPWSHNILILSREMNDSATLCYAQEGVAKGWNRDLLLNALKLKMHETHALVSTDNNVPWCNRANPRIGVRTPNSREDQVVPTRTWQRLHFYW